MRKIRYQSETEYISVPPQITFHHVLEPLQHSRLTLIPVHFEYSVSQDMDFIDVGPSSDAVKGEVKMPFF